MGRWTNGHPTSSRHGSVFSLRNGETLERSCLMPAGENDSNPLSDEMLNQKFVDLSSRTLDLEKAQGLLEKLWQIETAENVRT